MSSGVVQRAASDGVTGDVAARCREHPRPNALEGHGRRGNEERPSAKPEVVCPFRPPRGCRRAPGHAAATTSGSVAASTTLMCKCHTGTPCRARVDGAVTGSTDGVKGNAGCRPSGLATDESGRSRRVPGSGQSCPKPGVRGAVDLCCPATTRPSESPAWSVRCRPPFSLPMRECHQ